MRRDSDQRIVEGTDLAVICSNGYVSNSNSRICDRSYIEKPYGPFQRFMGLALPEYDDTGLSLRPQYLHASSESFQLVESLAHALMQEAIVQSAALEA